MTKYWWFLVQVCGPHRPSTHCLWKVTIVLHSAEALVAA